MKIYKFILFIVVLTAAGVLIFGCAAGKNSLVKNGTVKLITDSCDDIHIVYADIKIDRDNKICITGKLKPHKKYRSQSLFGNINIKCTDKNGAVYKSASIPFRLYPNHIKRNKEFYF